MWTIVAAVCRLCVSLLPFMAKGDSFRQQKHFLLSKISSSIHSYHNPIVFQSLESIVNLNLFYSFFIVLFRVCVSEKLKSSVYRNFPWNWLLLFHCL